jgi:hypothetical protein
MVDEDLPHHAGGVPEEVVAALEGRHALVDEPQVRLVDERGRCQGVGEPLRAGAEAVRARRSS